MTAVPMIRIEEAGLGPDAQVRLVLSGVKDLDKLHRAWASSGAIIEHVGDRMHATTTVEALARAVGRTLGKQVAADVDRTLREAVSAWQGPPPSVPLPGGATLDTGARPLVMGVVNVTPDSFSDGGAVYPGGHPGQAIALGERLVAEGADILDVGGESTRPGADTVEVEEELRRVVPVVSELAGLGVPISIDTVKAAVAEAALEAGAAIVNDVSCAAGDDLLRTVAGSEAAYVLMHTRGTPKDMQERADYGDVVAEVYEELAVAALRCERLGIGRNRILVDPGIGFAKTAEHSLALLGALRQLRGLGRPVLLGASRKSFLGRVLVGAEAGDRLEGSLACAVSAVMSGAAVVRAHDVAETVRAVRVAHAIATGALPRQGGDHE